MLVKLVSDGRQDAISFIAELPSDMMDIRPDVALGHQVNHLNDRFHILNLLRNLPLFKIYC